MFKIEKGIPIPSPKRKKSKYPFKEMEIGDSFECPIPQSGTQSLRNSINYFRLEFPTRQFKIVSISSKLARIWRVK